MNEILATILALTASSTIAADISATSTVQEPPTKYLQTIVERTNDEREVDLNYDLELQRRAQIRADYLCKNDIWSHDYFPLFFAGYGVFLGENLGKNFTNPHRLHNAWMKSEGHRKNILDERFARIGVAKAADCNLVVQFFN